MIYFYLAEVGVEPTPALTVAPSNKEETVIHTRSLCSLKRCYHKSRFMLDVSALPVG